MGNQARSNPAAPAITALVVALLLGGCGRAIGPEAGASGAPTTAPPSTSVSATATEAPSEASALPPAVTPTISTPIASSEPPTYLAIGGTSAAFPVPTGLAEVSSASGHILRQLIPPEPGGGAFWPTLPADRSVIYVQQGAGTCGAQISEISPTGAAIRSAIGQTAAYPNDEQVDGLPSVTPDGAMLAFHREICDIGVVTGTIVDQLVIMSTTTGKDLATSSSAMEPASPQAWSPDGRMLLAYSEASPTGTMHLLSVGTDGQISVDRVLAPRAGCDYEFNGLFDPATGQILAVQRCGSGGSIVVLDASTADVVGTLLSLPNSVPHVEAIDRSGQYLIYGSGLPRSSGPSWFVLHDGQSSTLPTPPDIDSPASW